MTAALVLALAAVALAAAQQQPRTLELTAGRRRGHARRGIRALERRAAIDAPG
jgi:hypothetical protein